MDCINHNNWIFRHFFQSKAFIRNKPPNTPKYTIQNTTVEDIFYNEIFNLIFVHVLETINLSSFDIVKFQERVHT